MSDAYEPVFERTYRRAGSLTAAVFRAWVVPAGRRTVLVRRAPLRARVPRLVVTEISLARRVVRDSTSSAVEVDAQRTHSAVAVFTERRHLFPGLIPLRSHHVSPQDGSICLGSAALRVQEGRVHPVDAVLMTSWMDVPRAYSLIDQHRTYASLREVAASQAWSLGFEDGACPR